MEERASKVLKKEYTVVDLLFGISVIILMGYGR